MKLLISIIIFVLLVACNSNPIEKTVDKSAPTKPANEREDSILKNSQDSESKISEDTTSFEYFTNLLRNERAITPYWIANLESLRLFAVPKDSTSRLSFVRDWKINDSMSVLILSRSTGTGYDEYLITIGHGHDFVGSLHISDNADSDLSPDNPYFYTEYKIIDARKIKLTNHKITGTEGGEEKDRVISIEMFSIQANGKIIKI